MSGKNTSPENKGTPQSRAQHTPKTPEAKGAHPSATARAEWKDLLTNIEKEKKDKKEKMEKMLNNPKSYLLEDESWVNNKAESGGLLGAEFKLAKNKISSTVDEKFPKYKHLLDEAGLSSPESVSGIKSVIKGIIFEHYTKTGKSEDKTEKYTENVLLEKLKKLLSEYTKLKQDIEKLDKQASNINEKNREAKPEEPAVEKSESTKAEEADKQKDAKKHEAEAKPATTPASTPSTQAPEKPTTTATTTNTPAPEKPAFKNPDAPTSKDSEKPFDLANFKTGDKVFDKILEAIKNILPAGFLAQFTGMFDKLMLSITPEFSGLTAPEKKGGEALKKAAKKMGLKEKTMTILFKDGKNLKKIIQKKESENLSWEKYIEKYLTTEEQKELKKKPSSKTNKGKKIAKMLLSPADEESS